MSASKKAIPQNDTPIVVRLSPLEASAWQSGPAFDIAPPKALEEQAQALFEVRALSSGDDPESAQKSAKKMSQAFSRARRKIEEATRFEIVVVP